MHIEVLRGPAGPGRRPWEEHELRGLLGELARRGVEAEPGDPLGHPVPRVSGPGRPGSGPARRARIETETEIEAEAETEAGRGPEPEVATGTGQEPGTEIGRELGTALAPGAGTAPAPGTVTEPGSGPYAPERTPAVEALLLVALGVDPVLDRTHLAGWLERVRRAVRAGRPVVISGLVLDPGTVPPETLRELLSAASLVGLRDDASLVVARRLCPDHPALRVGWDDALLLPQPAARSRRPEPEEQEGPEEREGPARIVAALGRPTGPFLAGDVAPVLAAALNALVHRTGAAVTLLACGGTEADEEFVADVAALLREDVRWDLVGADRADTEGADTDPADAVLRRADYVLTTCGRAAARGLAAHAVVLPVAPDKYSMGRMEGVLGRWGLNDGVVPLAALLTPGDVAWDTSAAVQQWATEAVEHRGAVRAALVDAEPVVRESGARWWDGVVGALRGGRPPSVQEPAASLRGVGAPVVRALRRRYTVPEVPCERPTLAVVLRSGGHADRLDRSLDDVLAQTFTDWRLVVVDDGGDPAPVDELLAQRRNELAGRVTVLHHRRSLGRGAAANRGLRAADSELVVLHDGTDRWGPLVLQAAVAHLEDPLVVDDGVVVRSPGGQVPVGAAGRERLAREALTLTDVLDGDRATVGPTFLYRRAVHGVLGDYDETLGAAADWEFALRFLETFTAGLLPGGALPRQEPAGGTSAAHDELVVRERHLRQWTAENGIGLPLYLRRAVAEEAGGLHRRLDAAEGLAHELLDVVRAQSRQIERLEQVVREKGFTAFWRRLWNRLRGG